ncbi:MAG: dTDP-4-dehydrorhamnose 3,5-epimerase [Granulosicoccus sp.]
MKFVETPLSGAWQITPESHKDNRGSFARLFCVEEFAEHGLNISVQQMNESINHLTGTTRGLHFQNAPHAEDKLVRCVQGRAFDVMVDLRSDSNTRHQWFGCEISQKNGISIYIPKGFAHGFQTLEPDTVLHYLISSPHTPGFEGGIRWDDKQLNIEWPLTEQLILSDRDRSLPTLATVAESCEA